MAKTHVLRFAACALALGCAATANAQMQDKPNFVGPAVGLTASSIQTSFSYNGNSRDLGNKSANAVGLAASWGFGLGADWVLTAELSYSPDTVDLAKETVLNTLIFPEAVQTNKLKAKNDMGFSVEPGYRLTANQLVYGKLSYHKIDVEASSDRDGSTKTQSIDVPGYGIGYAYAISPQVQLQLEYEALMYSRSGLTKASQDVVRVGLNYRF